MALKILHLSRSDISEGAAKGAYSLHRALQKAGAESKMFVADKQSDDYSILGPKGEIENISNKLRRVLDSFPLYQYKNKTDDYFSPAWIPHNIEERIKEINPDIINLHWICKGFLNPESIAKFKQPVVWTLRDMWPFTGGCHYSGECLQYKDKCGSCPQLNSQKEKDISRKLWLRKNNAWQNLDITVVTISNWLANCAEQSNLFKNRRIQVIHNALDESIFKPINKSFAREVLKLPQDRKLVLFGALNAVSDRRKGFEYLATAIQKIAKTDMGKDMELMVFGASQPQNPPALGLKATYMGRLNDEVSLALVYAAADVTLVPSIQEAFGKTAMESLACATPVVSFDSTGLQDIVEHEKNGYRAKCFDADELANGILWVLQDERRWQALSRRAREKVEQEFTLEIQARKYLNLYQQVIQVAK